MSYDGPILVIKGKSYTSANLHLLPLDINGYSSTSKIDAQANIISFFGELNPLSNFHPTPFSINGHTYHSSEQFIQHQKCLLFGDKITEHLVMTSDTPLECKIASKDIRNYDHERWKQNIKASCIPGILAKFEQNPNLANLLKSTASNKLVECCRDKDWGTGIPLHDSNALNPSYSQGLLGEMLKSICTFISSPLSTNNSDVMDVAENPNVT